LTRMHRDGTVGRDRKEPATSDHCLNFFIEIRNDTGYKPNTPVLHDSVVWLWKDLPFDSCTKRINPPVL